MITLSENLAVMFHRLWNYLIEVSTELYDICLNNIVMDFFGSFNLSCYGIIVKDKNLPKTPAISEQ